MIHAEQESVILAPQPGPQTEFLSTKADIALYGGGAGGGKSYALLLEPIRHYNNPFFSGMIFRRNTVQVRTKGGLWEESMKIYPQLGAVMKESNLNITFPSGASMKFAHLEYDSTVLGYQGAQIPYMGFDELTHFSEQQFFYMLSRNRSTSGVPAYVRATCNPDADSWVRKLIDWYIGPDGYVIKERSGVVRYFIRTPDGLILWGNTPEELTDKHPGERPKSFTFIEAKLEDNKILMEKDPGYMANLMALPRVDRARLLGGNWNVKATSGDLFRREWFKVIDTMPTNVVRICRAWDKAATKPSPTNPDPDWTRGVKIAKLDNGKFVVMDMASCRDTPGQVENLVVNTTTQDGHSTTVRLAQDPGSAGVAELEYYVKLLAGYHVTSERPSQNKVTRAKPLSSQAEHLNVWVLRGEWNEAWFTEMENFDGVTGHDDIVDATADAFNELAGGVSILNVL